MSSELGHPRSLGGWQNGEPPGPDCLNHVPWAPEWARKPDTPGEGSVGPRQVLVLGLKPLKLLLKALTSTVSKAEDGVWEVW